MTNLSEKSEMQYSLEIQKQSHRMCIWLREGPIRALSRGRANRQSSYLASQEQVRLSRPSTAWRWSRAWVIGRVTLFRRRYLHAILFWRPSVTAKQSGMITRVASGSMCRSFLEKITHYVKSIIVKHFGCYYYCKMEIFLPSCQRWIFQKSTNLKPFHIFYLFK